MRRNKTTLWLAGLVALVLLIAINIGYRIVLADLRDSIDERIGEQLSGLAESFASRVEVRTLRQATGDGDSFSPGAFLQLWNATREFADANRLDNVVLLDTSWNELLSEAPDSLSLALRALLDREGRGVLQTGLSWVSDTYEWEGSYYRSAAAPIIDQGIDLTVAIVRIEADAQYFEPLERLGTVGLWIHILSAGFAVALLVLFVWYDARTRHWEQQLLHTEKLIGLGRLAATIAHEIRNPLGIIKATAQRLQRLEERGNVSVEERRKLLQFVPEESDRLDRILNGYLSVADQASGQRQRFSMENHLPQWIEQVSKQADTEVPSMTLDIQPTGAILCDPDTPRQVVLNLLRNAIQVSSPESSIEVLWREDNHRHGTLSVTDHGPGIPRRHRRRVFEPFFSTKSKGSGLGLYAVQTMVDRDGGDITIMETPGGGATFTVRWPLADTRKDSGQD